MIDTMPSPVSQRTITLRLGHSPDPDDAFMWWPLFEVDGHKPRIETGRFRFEPVLADIESLNQRSMTGELEITAISCAQYPWVKDRYALTSCGASMGDAYGPKLIARRPMTLEQLSHCDGEGKMTIAVPGTHTSAFAALCLLLGRDKFGHATVPFETIIEQVSEGRFEAGVVIHEGQLTFEQAGLHLVVDLGQWWFEKFNLPLPLGVNVIRRDLERLHGAGTLAQITRLLLESVEYALANRDEGIGHAQKHGRGMSSALTDKFVGMYVNKWTLDFGPTGREAVRVFLKRAHEAGVVCEPGEIDFVEPA